MHPMRMLDAPVRTGLLAALLLSLSACVTINIYFPAAAAEKAADKIIDDVLQLKEQPGAPKAGSNAPSAAPATQGAM